MGKRVLLIEYEPRYLERVRTMLSPPEYTVVEAHDGEEGLNAFTSSPFDLVVLSGMLPRLPSAEVIREIRRKGGAAAPPILLMVTGYKGSNPKADAQRVGAFDLLVKPFPDEAMRDAVRAALESGDLGARTMRIPVADAVAPTVRLTSSDIFSDLLDDIAGESPPSGAPPRLRTPTEAEVEKRLKDTLSGGLGGRGARPAAPSTGPPTPPAAPKFSTDADIDRMISDTLSGLKIPKKTPPPQAALRETTPPPAAAGPTAAPGILPATRPVAAPLAGGPDRFDQYEIIEKISAGGMAEVYKARRSGVEGFEKTVAIKKILPHLADNEEFIAMFADEAKLAAQLNHPNIVHIYDLGKIESGGYFIAMEYVDGRDLRAILQAGKETGTPLPAPLAVSIASKVASALDYAHRRRDADGRDLAIVHRDVSPQNILISYEGDIKLCDFGIAKAATKASTTQSGALKGKLQYMSPEQAWGKPIDRRSDLFSLGTVLYEMLTGEKLFHGDSDLTVLEKVRAAEVSPPSSISPEVPKSLDAIVLRALARDTEERYANASDLLRDLESVLYSYTPAPGSADLAIYLHRLAAEEGAAAEVRQREAARAASQPEPERKRRSKGAPVARRATGSAPRAVPEGAAPAPPSQAPAPAAYAAAAPALPKKKESTRSGVFGTFSTGRVEAEKKKRRGLFAVIGVAALALVGVVGYLALAPTGFPQIVRAPATPPPTNAPPPTPAAPLVAAVTPAPQPVAIDPRLVEQEVERQLAARKRELQRALEAKPPPARREEESPAQAPLVEPTSEEPAPTAVPTAEPAAIATEVPVAEAPPARPTREPEVLPGDLVGPGPGVLEPVLVSSPRVAYPPAARQQRISGKVIALVLVDETGAVSEARIQRGVVPRSGVNEAVLDAMRGSRFRPATKNGVPVKMWRTVVVDVKP